MHRFAPLFCLIGLSLSAMSAPIDKPTAQTAATHFLQGIGAIKTNERLIPYEGLPSDSFENTIYIFNYDTLGFVIVGADDRCTPILGYSMNGSFDYAKAPENMKSWLQECASSIKTGIQENAPDNKDTRKKWDDLLTPPRTTPSAPKSESYLLTSTWEQGSGYNLYCPVMNGQHVVVGCVATTMAQIIRYYGKPARGFGHKSYVHSVYGTQSVDFDTTEYDYSLMPDRIRRSSTSAQRDMVSRLCYHCGVVVNMEYQHAGHTSGSGASASNVPNGLMYFGYTEAQHYIRLTVNNDSLWAAMIRNEIDNLRPIAYSGYSDEGGHAFVLDGYNDNEQYHFNWGWGGYSDGFYSLTTMVGFTSNHQMTINIYPSGWDGHLSQFLVSPNGNGDGTSWDEANSDINAAIKLNKLVNRDIWLKEGIYYGDTTGEYSYDFNGSATITGGFAGTETSYSEHDPANHPTIFDGQGRHCLLNAHPSGTPTRQMKIQNIHFQNGYSPAGSVIRLSGDVLARNITIQNCRTDSGSIVYAYDCRLIANSIYGNQSPTICQMSSSTMRQSMIYNNDGDAMTLSGYSRIANCDIVSNQGTGVVFKHPRNTFINNIVWNNDVNLHFDTTLTDTSFRHCAIEGDIIWNDSTSLQLDSNNSHANGPRFLHPSTSRGIQGIDPSIDWHLGRGSICINAGERLSECLTDGDFDQSIRSRNGAIDLGCYESNYPVSITSVEDNTSLSVYPNPTYGILHLNHCKQGKVQIFDITGRPVMESRIADGSNRLDIGQLPQGVYFLKAGENTYKIVKR